ncbi:IS701 family transposase [Xanthobacter autotrophicus ATCC 700551]
MNESWKSDLDKWLTPFVSALGHKVRARLCPLYVAGLIGPGDRKSIQPMAAREGGVGYDQLHHFVAAGTWDQAPLEDVLLQEADRMVGGQSAFLIIDDTALPKKGKHSVGVAPQYATTLGKNANCQTLVSTTLAQDEVPVMVGLRLFLPESWTSDPDRMIRARVPDARQSYKTKLEIALEEIDRIRTAGVRFGCVLADAGYGLSAAFRQGLSARGLIWAVGVGGRQKVYPAGVALTFPMARRGRPRKNPVPDVTSLSAEKTLASTPWRTLSWRRGTKGLLKARFAAVRIRVADGPPQRIGDMGQQHLPGEEAWLIGEHRSTGERKYYLSNLPADTPLKRLAGAVKARWACEQAHQQLKEELGLDHFEGRSWSGLHRHALMTMIAYAFLQNRRLRQASGGKKDLRAPTAAEPAGDPPGHPGSDLYAGDPPMSKLQGMAQT